MAEQIAFRSRQAMVDAALAQAAEARYNNDLWGWFKAVDEVFYLIKTDCTKEEILQVKAFKSKLLAIETQDGEVTLRTSVKGRQPALDKELLDDFDFAVQSFAKKYGYVSAEKTDNSSESLGDF